MMPMTVCTMKALAKRGPSNRQSMSGATVWAGVCCSICSRPDGPCASGQAQTDWRPTSSCAGRLTRVRDPRKGDFAYRAGMTGMTLRSSARSVAQSLQARDGGAAQAFEGVGDGEGGPPPRSQAHQVVREAATLAPDMVDHGVIRGGAGVRAFDVRIVEQGL